MATLVLEQDESVKQIEASAVQANTDVEHGCVGLPSVSPPARHKGSPSFIFLFSQTQTNQDCQEVGTRSTEEEDLLLRLYVSGVLVRTGFLQSD